MFNLEEGSDKVLIAGGVICLIVVCGMAYLLLTAPGDAPKTHPQDTNIIYTHPEKPTPTPQTSPIPVRSPTPAPIATPEPTPTPTPVPPRWCDSGGCHWGTPPPQPTPAPTPIPTPTPAELWQTAGMKCFVPDRLVPLPWVKVYRFQCTCDIQAKYQLGPDFSPFEGCAAAAGWAKESCECREKICAGSSGLC